MLGLGISFNPLWCLGAIIGSEKEGVWVGVGGLNRRASCPVIVSPVTWRWRPLITCRSPQSGLTRSLCCVLFSVGVVVAVDDVVVVCRVFALLSEESLLEIPLVWDVFREKEKSGRWTGGNKMALIMSLNLLSTLASYFMRSSDKWHKWPCVVEETLKSKN